MKRFSTFLILIILHCFLCNKANGQAIIKGTIIDKETKEPLSAVYVNLIKSTQFNTVSRLKNESKPVEEINFTPGTPFFC